MKNCKFHFEKVVVTVTTTFESGADKSPSSHTKLRLCLVVFVKGKKRTKHANNSVERGNKTLETTLQPTFRVKLITIFTQQRRVESISGVRHSVFQADQSRRGDVTSSCRERRRYQ